jgi:hypothetical protein
MQHCTEIFSGGLYDMLVSYDYEVSPPQIEEGHGFHDVGSLVNAELKSVEIMVSGNNIEILRLMNKEQKEDILSRLNYE